LSLDQLTAGSLALDEQCAIVFDCYQVSQVPKLLARPSVLRGNDYFPPGGAQKINASILYVALTNVVFWLGFGHFSHLTERPVQRRFCRKGIKKHRFYSDFAYNAYFIF